MKRKTKLVYIIKRSCLTGRAIWIYHGSQEAGRKLYRRVCKREIHRVKHLWGSMVSRRQKNIVRLMNVCADRNNGELTKEQKKAARQLQQLSKHGTSCDRELYNHVVSEIKHRNTTSDRWHKNRLKWLNRSVL